MINVSEHVYHDDPRQGHPDVRTRLAEAEYFFLGNGLIQAAVQFAPAGEGSPYGLLIQDPMRLTAKRDALTFDVESGLEPTMLVLSFGTAAETVRPGRDLDVRWTHEANVPAVRASWSANGVAVDEFFVCPNRHAASLARRITLANRTAEPIEVLARTGVCAQVVEWRTIIEAGDEARQWLLYEVVDGRHVRVARVPNVEIEAAARASAAQQTTFVSGVRWLDHVFLTAADQLPATVDRVGRVDASLWQYTREWVRDHALMARGLVLAGHHQLARTMIDRLIREFIADDGSPMDSSERRDVDEVELDQNGILLSALCEYVWWTGDEDFARAHWPKVIGLAEFPLGAAFRHELSGLLCNRRDFWERHAAHGIEPGMELAHQVFVSLGLEDAAALARVLGDAGHAERWSGEGARLRRGVLEDPTYGFVDDGRLIKRRGVDGRVQTAIVPSPGAGLPRGVRLAEDIDHPLNPDSAVALPVAWGLLAGDSPIAHASLDDMETLWNQGWAGGGYGRYHMDSDADSPGPWPFVNLYIARASVETGRDDHAWRAVNWLETIAGARAGSWFEMYGPHVSPPYAQVGIVPWTWAEAILLCVRHILGLRVDEHGVHVRPRLLRGIDELRARVPVRGHAIALRVVRSSSRDTADASGDLPVLQRFDDGFVFAYPDRDVVVEIELPVRSDPPIHSTYCC